MPFCNKVLMFENYKNIVYPCFSKNRRMDNLNKNTLTQTLTEETI